MIVGGLVAMAVAAARPPGGVRADDGLQQSVDLAIEAVGAAEASGEILQGIPVTGSGGLRSSEIGPAGASLSEPSAGWILDGRLSNQTFLSRLAPPEGGQSLVVVPLPAPLWAGLGGLGMVFFLRARRG